MRWIIIGINDKKLQKIKLTKELMLNAEIETKWCNKYLFSLENMNYSTVFMKYQTKIQKL